jgi:hypothetical protein
LYALAFVGIVGCASVSPRDLSELNAEPFESAKLLEGRYWDEKEFGLPHSDTSQGVSLWQFLTHQSEPNELISDNVVTISHCTESGFDATLSGHYIMPLQAHVTGHFQDGYFFPDPHVEHMSPLPLPVINVYYKQHIGIGRTRINDGLTLCCDQDGVLMLLVVPASAGTGYKMNACFDRTPIATAE